VPNAVFDLAWSENTPGLLAAACGDGNIRVKIEKSKSDNLDNQSWNKRCIHADSYSCERNKFD